MSRLTAITLLGLASTAPSGVESFSTLASRNSVAPAFEGTGTSISSHGEKISISPRAESSRLGMGSDFSSHPYSHYYGTSGSTAQQNFEQNDEINDIYGYGEATRGRERDRFLDDPEFDDRYADYYTGDVGGRRGRDRRMVRERGSYRDRPTGLDDLREGPARLARVSPRNRGAPTFSKRYVDEERMMEEDRRMRDIEFRRRNNDLAERVEERHVLDRMDELIQEHDRLAARLDAMEEKSEELARESNARTDGMLRAVHEEQQEATKRMMESVLGELQVVQRTLESVQTEQQRRNGTFNPGQPPPGSEMGVPPPPPPERDMGVPPPPPGAQGPNGGYGESSPPPPPTSSRSAAATPPPNTVTTPPPQQQDVGPVSPPPPASQTSSSAPPGAQYQSQNAPPQGYRQPPPPQTYQQQQQPPRQPLRDDREDDLRGRPPPAVVINGGVNGNTGGTFKTGPPKMVDPDNYGAANMDEPTSTFAQRKMGMREKPAPPERSTEPRKATLRDRVFREKGRDENQIPYGEEQQLFQQRQQQGQPQQQQQQPRGGIPPQQQSGYGAPPRQGPVSPPPPPSQQQQQQPPQQQQQQTFPSSMQPPQAQAPPPPPQQQAPPPPPPPSYYDDEPMYPQGGVNTFEPGGDKQRQASRRPPPSKSNSFGNFGGGSQGGRPRGRASGFGGSVNGAGRGQSTKNFGEESGSITFTDTPDGGRCFLT
mmetsp:Transcript_11168/g.26838  ORF Transcript_11168/g.26838 Transcript_11168/m.26838 type:complete len:709 (+) Transcript_11168:167-2293(+)